MRHVTVIGAGAWGTALAAAARRAERDVKLYAREAEVVESVNTKNINETFLPDVELPEGIFATSNMEAAVYGADAALLVVPSQFLRATAVELAKYLPEDLPVLLAAKGIEQKTLMLMNEVVEETLPGHPLAALSGPSFAKEVARGLPAAITLACADETLGEQLMQDLASSRFRIYQSSDVVGAEIGGAVKNVLAIACGIVEGRKLGDNAKAALITRGLAEMMRLGEAKGAEMETMVGLGGLGDLVLTCNAMQSRNFSFGFAVGEGQKPKDVLESRVAVTEGVANAISVTQLAKKMKIEMPICETVHAIIHEGQDIDGAIISLMERPLKSEFE